MDAKEKIKRRILGWKAWDSKWRSDSLSNRKITPSGRPVSFNTEITMRHKRLNELIDFVVETAIATTQNPPAKKKVFYGYEDTPTKKNRRHQGNKAR